MKAAEERRTSNGPPRKQSTRPHVHHIDGQQIESPSIKADLAPYPPTVLAARQGNTGVSTLHVPGPRFGRGLLEPDEPTSPSKLLDRVHRHVSQLTDADVPAPDLVVVTGDLIETAHQQQMDAAWNFLTGLRVKLGLDAQRLIVVPGAHDMSKKLCSAYFSYGDGRDITPEPPYFPKLELYNELFADLYHGSGATPVRQSAGVDPVRGA